MDFEHKLKCWLDDSLAQDVPDSVKVFSVNLYEPALVNGVKYGIEIVGTGEFDEDDPDWAFDEVWEPDSRGINIHVEYSGDEWEQCLNKLKALLFKHLGMDSPSILALKSKKGVDLGIVDTDLEIIWKP
jgi:hypothetical protein